MPNVSPASARNADDLLREIVTLYEQTQRSVKTTCCEASNKECEAITLLGRRGPLTIQEFAAGMGLEKTWASRLADRLEARGLAMRGKHPEDGRCCLLRLTAKGAKACESIESSIDDTASQLLKRVPADKRAGVASALEVLRDALAGVATGCCGQRKD